MSNYPVILIAFKESDNLGVGYLASTLSEEGFDPLIIDFREGEEKIIQVIRRVKPKIIGFSVIFQFHIYEFRKLINYLRKSGINSHFSAGGQYASLMYKDLFKYIPSLESIVRFDGEYTFLELVRCIYSGTDWHKIKGIVYKNNGEIFVNPLRQPEMDLDRFPYPIRSTPENYALEKKLATLLAGRGCVNNCSFCNNTEYIKQSSVPFRRLRKPEKVVEEIKFLNQKKDCSIFLFEDDDFPVKTREGSDWIDKFCQELKRNKLADKVMWKINCRPDEVDFNSFSMMKNNGLYMVFLGIDDGTDSGLLRLNKHMTKAESMKGINLLKKLEIDYDYGFMLFQPSSTFRSVIYNLDFLKELCCDGSTPVTFLKLEPFFATRIEDELRNEGRLKGKPGFLDYDFLSSSLDHYYKFINSSFMEWINHPEGLVNVAKWSIIYLSVFSHFYKMTAEVKLISSNVRKIVSQSNIFILDTMRELAFIFESGNYESGKHINPIKYRKHIKEKHNHYRDQLVNSVKEICRIAEYQRLMKIIKYRSTKFYS